MTAQYETIRVHRDGVIGRLQIHRPEANNTINQLLAEECRDALAELRGEISVLVVEGLAEVFCFGADFEAIERAEPAGRAGGASPETLYDVWVELSTGPFVSVAHVRGKANAGGMGFVAACDIVLAETRAVFSLSELLFGLMPACVLPFMVRRMGFQRAHYTTLMTQPFSAEQAAAWGLVDAHATDSETLLRKHLLRLRRLSKKGVARYKSYARGLGASLSQAKRPALAANREVFTDVENLEKIARYVRTGAFPWEA